MFSNNRGRGEPKLEKSMKVKQMILTNHVNRVSIDHELKEEENA